MLMAGLDWIRKEIDPGAHGFGPVDKNIYELSPAEKAAVKSVPGSLDECLQALVDDHEFLLEGGVFDRDFIETWIDFKRSTEVQPVSLRPHPYEYQLYFDLLSRPARDGGGRSSERPPPCCGRSTSEHSFPVLPGS
jgi:glutamine synthetase